MNHPRRPRRPQRMVLPDRLLHPDATAEEMRCNMALAPFDHAAREMDRTWGINRLPELVSVETAEKWGSAMAKLNDAISANNPDDVKARVGVCLRGFEKMDAEARSLGRSPIKPEWWEIEIDGETVAILRDVSEWAAFQEMRPGVRYHTLREVAVALKYIKDGGKFDAIREHFPKAELTAVRDAAPAVEDWSDGIPF